MPKAAAPWVLDSGGFTELNLHGRWETTPAEYVDACYRYQTEIGQLAWAAPQDWMCEPFVLERTGGTVDNHQARTVENYLTLTDLAPDLPFIPVLQGFTLNEYERCANRYTANGVNLAAHPVVGIGSVCRRQATREAAHIIRTLANTGLQLHGFGLKLGAIDAVGDVLVSSDSMAWSYGARRNPPLPGCAHRSCANCLTWATAWQAKVVARAGNLPPRQLALF